MRTKLVGVLILILLVAVTGFSVVSARRLGTQAPPGGALAAGLASRVTTLMEHDFRALTAPDAGQVDCTARPFGVRPEGLTRADQATTIYAWVYCRAPSGRRLLTPVALHLGRPPTIRVPDGGDDRDRSIRRIFPADVREALRATEQRAAGALSRR